MQDRLKEFIQHHELFDAADQVLLAVSGGVDSMTLLDLLRNAGQKLSVAHCNFQLRADASDEDERFVEEYCQRHKITFFGKRFETKNYAEKSGLSIQMAARELRYDWFKHLLEKENIPWLATAHHLNDNLETVLMRWTKGASLELLTGIPLRQGKVVRPLLFAKRSEILQYAQERKLAWREDASNAGEDYQRNFMRHQVIPKLKEINPSLEDTFANSLEKINGGRELMLRGLDQLKDNITRTEGQNFLIDKSLLALMKHPAFICFEWLKIFGFEWERCQQIVNAMDGQSGKQFLSATHQATIDREYIIVSPIFQLTNDILIEEGQDKAALGSWQLTLKNGEVPPVATNRNEVTLDRSRLKFPLLWRKWRSGDYFYPLGFGHRKKVSDFLIDEKVPLSDKNLVTVIESGGEIIWVVAYRADDRYKVTAGTRSALSFHVDII